MTSFCATLPSPKTPKDTESQAEPAKGRPTEISIDSLPPVTRTKPLPSSSNPFLRSNQCKKFWPKNLVQLARNMTNLPSNRPTYQHGVQILSRPGISPEELLHPEKVQFWFGKSFGSSRKLSFVMRIRIQVNYGFVFNLCAASKLGNDETYP